MNKKVYYFNVGIHTYVLDMLNNPPKGYDFLSVSKENSKKTIDKLKKSKLASFLYKRILKKIFNVQLLLNKIYYKKSPDNIDLIYSNSMIEKEDKPWVIEILDGPYSLAGNDYSLFMKNKSKIANSLESSNCKKIIVHTLACKKIFEKHFSKKVIDKIIILKPGISIKNKLINRKNNKVTFLFMGSINNPDEFLIKGGLEALETFKRLKLKNKEIRLIVKCKVPDNIKKRYENIKDLKFIEKNIDKEELNKLYVESDFLLMPGHIYFLMATLESFSFGLPIIALDTYGVNEFIIDGKNGFLIKKSDKIPYDEPDYPVNIREERFLEAIKNVDEKVINDLVKKCESLIKNKKNLLKLKKSTYEIFKKKYTIERKNFELKRIFDEALIK